MYRTGDVYVCVAYDFDKLAYGGAVFFPILGWLWLGYCVLPSYRIYSNLIINFPRFEMYARKTAHTSHNRRKFFAPCLFFSEQMCTTCGSNRDEIARHSGFVCSAVEP